MKNFLGFSLRLSALVAAFSTLCPPALLSAKETPREEEASEVPVVIIGGGIGALTSALYLGRAGLEPVVIEGKSPGGLLTQSHSVQNWPGELEIEGGQLTLRVRKQAERSGAHFRSEEVVAVDFSKRPFTITTRSVADPEQVHRLQARSCIVAMGTQPNFLGIPGETGPDGYWGKGITNCAICDGNLYRGRKVGVVGGGDAAVLEALYLSGIAKEVHVFVRKDSLKAFEEKRVETLLSKPNVKIHYNTKVEKAIGDGEALTRVVLKGGSGKSIEFPLDGLFLAIGSTPNTGLFQGILKLDEKGYILLEKDQQTSVEGVYAIGDIVDPFYKQAISAAGDGAKAALQAQQYLSDRQNNLVAKTPKGGKNMARNEVFLKAAEPSGDSLAKQGTDKREKAPGKTEVIEISSKEQFDEEILGGIPVVVDFYATWCGPCKAIAPLFESSADRLAGKIKFLKVNVDKNYELSAAYEVRAMPTVLFLDRSGSVVDRKVGGEQIANFLKQLPQ